MSLDIATKNAAALASTCRIAFGHKPIDKGWLSIWIAPEDLVQLIRIGLKHPDVHRRQLVPGGPYCSNEFYHGIERSPT